MTARRYLSTTEVAEMLGGIDIEKVRNWAARGEFSIDDTAVVNLAERTTGKKPRIKIREDAVEAFLRRRAIAPPVKSTANTRRKDPAAVTTSKAFFEKWGT